MKKRRKRTKWIVHLIESLQGLRKGGFILVDDDKWNNRRTYFAKVFKKANLKEEDFNIFIFRSYNFKTGKKTWAITKKERS